MEVDIQDIQMDHDYISNVQPNDTNVVVDQPKLNVDIPRVHQDRNSVKKAMQNVVVEQPKVNIKLPTTSSVQAAVQNVVVQQPKVNIKLPAKDQHLSSKQKVRHMVVDQQKSNTDIPKTHQYGRIPTKDAVFKPKHAQVLLPMKVKNVHHSETVTAGPQELSVYAEMENTGQEKELPRKKHIDDNVAGTSKSDVQSTSTKTSSKKFVCQYCGNILSATVIDGNMKNGCVA